MTPKPKSREPRSRKPKPVSNLEEKIRVRAYELYERRGRIDGFAFDDWLQAEQKFAERRSRAPTRKRVGDGENLNVDGD
jgi:hypothetical protein